MSWGLGGSDSMCVLGVEGSEKKCGPSPLRIISGTALMWSQSFCLSPSVCLSSFVCLHLSSAPVHLQYLQYFCWFCGLFQHFYFRFIYTDNFIMYTLWPGYLDMAFEELFFFFFFLLLGPFAGTGQGNLCPVGVTCDLHHDLLGWSLTCWGDLWPDMLLKLA